MTNPVAALPERRAPAKPRQETSATAERARVLCVDDEPRVLEGLALHLGRLFRLSTATSGALGLEVLDQKEPYAVVIADMRMPEMDGAAFLAIVRQRFPDTVRLLLTGYAEVEAAIAAINEGQIFRFLTKPCPPSQLLEAVRAAVELNRLVTSERVLLEQTLHGSIKALTDILALTHPLAFGRAMRIRQFVSELAERTGLEERWQLEIAAMVSQIGCVTLPAEIMEKVHYGHSLSDEEQKQVSSLPFLAERLLGHIPRLEAVRAILAGSGERRYASSPSQTADLDLVEKSAQMLRIATEYDTLESRGLSVDEALDSMRAQGGRYNGTLLQRFAELRGSAARTHEIREVPLHSVRVGMVLIEDLYLEGGILVAARGYEVTPGFVERSHNWHAQAKKTVRVAMPR